MVNKSKCCICQNGRPDYTLHSFPSAKYKDIYDKWIDAIGCKELSELPMDEVRKKYYVCETHFGQSDYFISNRVRKLKKNSVPTIGKNVDSPCTPRKDRSSDDITCTPESQRRLKKCWEEREEIEGAQYLTDENSCKNSCDYEKSWEESEDAVQIEVIPDIFGYR